MKISCRWLKELLPALKLSPQGLAEKLTLIGLEVEAIEDQSKKWEGIIVGLVLSKEKHPQADRLSVCRVSDGKQEYQVVCGAPNVEAEKKYPFAQIGTVFPNGLVIQKASLRGVESHGMLCSAKELGLAEESQGLLILSDKAKPGETLAHHLGYNDHILEVAVTPNRGDCLSHIGLARELASFLGLPFKQARNYFVEGTYPTKTYVKVRVRDRKACPRYCLRVIRGVAIGPSPQWLQAKLESLGVRPINNIVDATNYVMLETGHPLHAFDHRFVRGGSLVVRRAENGEVLKTLDATHRKLDKEDLVIADAEGPMALAGIMGGEHSGVQQDTSLVVLEAAAFNPDVIRKTAKKLGMKTESSYRFERGVSPEGVRNAMDRLARFILEFAGGELCQQITDLYPRKQEKLQFSLQEKTIHRLLGPVIPLGTVGRILKQLGLNPRRTKMGWRLEIPPYRNDLTREADIVEEIVRFYGMDQIPSQLPRVLMREEVTEKDWSIEKQVREFLISRGFSETIHYSFYDKELAAKINLNQEGAVLIQNPLSQEMSVMRQSLVPQLLTTLVKNKQASSSLRFFEIRSVYPSSSLQEKRLTGVFTGALWDKQWRASPRNLDFFDGKGFLTYLFNQVAVSWIDGAGVSYLHPHQSLKIMCGDTRLGVLGALHPEVAQKFEFNEPVYVFDVCFDKLVSKWKTKKNEFKPLSHFPSIGRDMALIADKDLSFGKILETISGYTIPWLDKVDLFDLYQGQGIPDGKKSLALSMMYQNAERTLTDEEVNQVHFNLVKRLQKDLAVSLR